MKLPGRPPATGSMCQCLASDSGRVLPSGTNRPRGRVKGGKVQARFGQQSRQQDPHDRVGFGVAEIGRLDQHGDRFNGGGDVLRDALGSLLRSATPRRSA
jgi:hypothetical protein